MQKGFAIFIQNPKVRGGIMWQTYFEIMRDYVLRDYAKKLFTAEVFKNSCCGHARSEMQFWLQMLDRNTQNSPSGPE